MLTEEYFKHFIFPATTFQLTIYVQECTALDENVRLSKAYTCPPSQGQNPSLTTPESFMI